MKRYRCLWLIVIFYFASSDFISAETTLEKIDKNGALIIGTRTGSPPFAYVNKNNDWVGFSIDLVEKAIGATDAHPALDFECGRSACRNHDRHSIAPRQRRFQFDVLHHRRPVSGEERRADQRHSNHRGQTHCRTARLHQRKHYTRARAEREAHRISRPTGGFSSTSPRPGTSLHERRNSACGPAREGAQAR